MAQISISVPNSLKAKLDSELQKLMSNDVTLCLDMGSFHLWLARRLYSFRARQILITNGQQTLGVALSWAIAATLVRPTEKVISISGSSGPGSICGGLRGYGPHDPPPGRNRTRPETSIRNFRTSGRGCVGRLPRQRQAICRPCRGVSLKVGTSVQYPWILREDDQLVIYRSLTPARSD